MSLEEVFSAHELIRDDPRSTRAEEGAARDALDDLLRAVRAATSIFGRGDAKKWISHARDGTSSPYAELLEKLVPDAAADPSAHSFITFNYDIALDKCALYLRSSVACDINYAVPLANHWTQPRSPDFGLPGTRALLVLRIHGSLNWVRCLACRSLFTTVDRHAHVTEMSACWSCNTTRMDYVLVHPTFLRRYDDPALQMVWGRAFRELLESDRWVFVGYSFPPADVHFRELLRACLRSRSERGASTEIVLVGLGPRGNPEFDATIDAYAAVFEANLCVWDDVNGDGFNGFVGAVDP